MHIHDSDADPWRPLVRFGVAPFIELGEQFRHPILVEDAAFRHTEMSGEAGADFGGGEGFFQSLAAAGFKNP